MLQEPSVRAWYASLFFYSIRDLFSRELIVSIFRSATYSCLGKLFSEPQYFANNTDEAGEAGMTAIDFEEQTAGYQAAYSRLAASETAEADPVAYVQNPLQFFQQELEKLSGNHGPQVKALIAAAGGGRIG